MRKIAIDDLVEMVDSRYSLVTIISKRARQIIDGSEPLVKTNTKKPVAIAIEEYYDDKYQEIYDYDKYKKELEAEKAEAVEKIETNEEEILEDSINEEETQVEE